MTPKHTRNLLTDKLAALVYGKHLRAASLCSARSSGRHYQNAAAEIFLRFAAYDRHTIRASVDDDALDICQASGMLFPLRYHNWMKIILFSEFDNCPFPLARVKYGFALKSLNDSDYSKIDEDECKPEAENKRKEGGTQVQKQDNKDELL